jgi:hypothetical protein
MRALIPPLFGLVTILLLMPVLASAQESMLEPLAYAPLLQYQERYAVLYQRFEPMLRQILDRRQTGMKWDVLMSVAVDLEEGKNNAEALAEYLLLASMVTEKQSVDKATSIVRSRYALTKYRTEHKIEFIEKVLHLSADAETTKLVLEARDIHRSFVDYLGQAEQQMGMVKAIRKSRSQLPTP